MSTHEQPWWHTEPEPPVDSVYVEGMKLFAVLRDWAVESGAAAAVADLAGSAAGSASAYLSQVTAPDSGELAEPDLEQPVVRCSDCPVCRGLDALEQTNPQMAQTARAALAQVNALLSGFLPGGGGANA
jgi:hypothetical protein